MSLTVYELAREFLVELHSRLSQSGRGKMLAGEAQAGDQVRSVVTYIDERDLEMPIEDFVPRFIVPAACAVASSLDEVASHTFGPLEILELPIERDDQANCTTRELGLAVRATIRYYPASPPEVLIAPAEGWNVSFEVAYRPQ